MERLYKALIGLAGVTLALGLIIVYLYATSAFNQFPNTFSTSSSDGLMRSFFIALYGQWPQIMLNLSSLLDGGVIALAAALAWANRRSPWLIALVVLELLTLVWPTFALIAQTQLFPPPSSGSPQHYTDITNLINLSVPLIPIALALIFALTRRRAAATSDAALGVVDGAL